MQVSRTAGDATRMDMRYAESLSAPGADEFEGAVHTSKECDCEPHCQGK
jgi:hypothetical protein